MLLKWLESLPAVVGARILPITHEIADIWGRLGIPNPLPVADGLIAATALAHDLTLVTRDAKDMARTGARLLNPFATGKTGG